MTIPKTQPERFEWIRNRAMRLDFIRDDEPNWIADELERLWNNPDEFEKGETYVCPNGVDERDYALVRLLLNFGIDYEREYPAGGDWEAPAPE